eukprot:scaffold63493_cov69-Phaeocystis_antarctica.AAC.7
MPSAPAQTRCGASAACSRRHPRRCPRACWIAWRGSGRDARDGSSPCRRTLRCGERSDTRAHAPPGARPSRQGHTDA